MPLPIPSSSEGPSKSETTATTTSSASHTGTSPATASAQHTKTEAEKAADKLYEERMEDDYAKREGGARDSYDDVRGLGNLAMQCSWRSGAYEMGGERRCWRGKSDLGRGYGR